MLKRFSIWINGAYILQFLTVILHSISFFAKHTGTNDTEVQMLNLMSTYKMNMGMGFSPTMMNILQSLSAGFTLLYLLGGLTILFLWIRQTELAIMKGVLAIQVGVFGVSFVVTACLSFIQPTVMTGLVFVFLLLAWITVPKELR